MRVTCSKHVIPNKLNICDLAHHESPCSSLVKLRQHKRCFACDGDASFFLNCRMANALWWLHLVTNFDKVCDFVTKIQLIEFPAIFFFDFFSCRITSARVATHVIFITHWQCNNFQIASPSRAKNCSCSRSFRASDW